MFPRYSLVSFEMRIKQDTHLQYAKRYYVEVSCFRAKSDHKQICFVVLRDLSVLFQHCLDRRTFCIYFAKFREHAYRARGTDSEMPIGYTT